MRFCHKCGTALPENATACPNCNTPVSVVSPQTPMQTQQTYTQPVYPASAQSQVQQAYTQPTYQAPNQVQPTYVQPTYVQPTYQPQGSMQQNVYAQPNPSVDYTPSPKSQKAKGRGGKIALIISVIVLVLAGIGAALYFLVFNKKASSKAISEDYKTVMNSYMQAVQEANYSDMAVCIPSYKLNEYDTQTHNISNMNLPSVYDILQSEIYYTLTYEEVSAAKMDERMLNAYTNELSSLYQQTGTVKNGYNVTLALTISYNTHSEGNTTTDQTFAVLLIDNTWYIYETGSLLELTIIDAAAMHLIPADAMFRSINELDPELLRSALIPGIEDTYFNCFGNWYGSVDDFFANLFNGYKCTLEWSLDKATKLGNHDLDIYNSFVTEVDSSMQVTAGFNLDYVTLLTAYDSNGEAYTRQGYAYMIVLKIKGVWYYYDGYLGNLDITDLIPEATYSYTGNEYYNPMSDYFYGFFTKNYDTIRDAYLPRYRAILDDYMSQYESEEDFFYGYFKDTSPDRDSYEVYLSSTFDEDDIEYYQQQYAEVTGDTRGEVLAGYTVDVIYNITCNFDDGTTDYRDNMIFLNVDGIWGLFDPGEHLNFFV